MKIRCIVVVAILLGGHSASADSIYGLIKRGELRRAADSLSRQVTASVRDGNTLFYQSLLEPNADRSAQLMEAALKAGVSTRYREEILYLLAQYYLIKGDDAKLSQTVMDYRTHFESARFRPQMARFSILADQMAGKLEAALRQVDRFLIEYGGDDNWQWGTIDKARIMQAENFDFLCR